MRKQLVLAVAAVLFLCGCTWHDRDTAVWKEKTGVVAGKAETAGEYIRKLKICGAEACVFDGYELDNGVVRAYMDGLSEDVYFLEEADADKEAVLKAYADIYKGFAEGLGYKVSEPVTMTKDHGQILQEIRYSGMLDGVECSGTYLLAATDSGGAAVVYVLNLPLSGLGEEGKQAFKELMAAIGQ